jgi:hypothetical protein
MLHRFHDRFGTAGVVIAVIALIAALGGTALAAGSLTSKQKKEVTKIAKKYAGKPGATGPAGPAGPAGTNGTNGTNGVGAKGDPGNPGQSVLVGSFTAEDEENEEPAGEPCQLNGGNEVEVEGSGVVSYTCNGSPWTAGGTLPGGATEDEEEDLEGWEEQVRERMREYQRFKEAALELMRRHQDGGMSFAALLEGEVVPSERLAINPDGLAAAFQAVLDRLPTPDEVAVQLSNYSLSEEMDRVRTHLRAGRLAFGDLFQQAESRLHAVVIFLALLELIRLGEAGVRQRSTFAEIEITAGPGA